MSATLNGDGATVGVPHSTALTEYGEAILRGDAKRRGAARLAVHQALGPQHWSTPPRSWRRSTRW